MKVASIQRYQQIRAEDVARLIWYDGCLVVKDEASRSRVLKRWPILGDRVLVVSGKYQGLEATTTIIEDELVYVEEKR